MIPVRVAVSTKHGKLAQIQPAFAALNQWRLEVAPLDTDMFGSFSGEVERRMSPRETVIEKAKAGARLLGLDFGIASEGTIGAHPHLPFINSDYELLAFVCLSQNISVVESYLSADIVAHSQMVSRTTDFEELFRKLNMPHHAVNIVVETSDGRQVIKGIFDSREALQIIEQSLATAKVTIESDFRAMNSPSRQANITICAQRLAARVAASCPGCSCFGWGRVGYEYGLPCRSCGRQNLGVANSERLGCQGCNYTETKHLGVYEIEPARCEFCNP
jgi:hypothetical protein